MIPMKFIIILLMITTITCQSPIGSRLASLFRRKSSQPQQVKPIDPSKLSVPELFETLSSLPASKFDKIADQIISETFGLSTFAPAPGAFDALSTSGSRTSAIFSLPPLSSLSSLASLRSPFDSFSYSSEQDALQSLIFPVFVAKESKVSATVQEAPGRSSDQGRRPSFADDYQGTVASAPSIPQSSASLHEAPKEARVTRTPLAKTYPLLDVSSSNESPQVLSVPHDPAQILKIFSQAFTGDSSNDNKISAAGSEPMAKVTLTPEMAKLASAASSIANLRTLAPPTFPVFVKGAAQSVLTRLS